MPQLARSGDALCDILIASSTIRIMTKKGIIISILLAISIVTIFIIVNPISLKLLAGSARVIGLENKSKIFINGNQKLNAKLFKVKSNFEENENRDYLILYLRDVKDYAGIPVWIIDKKNKIIAFPNASKNDYNLIFGNLIQSDSGANVLIPINDKLKGFSFDPNLKIVNKNISFEIIVNNQVQKITINIA